MGWLTASQAAAMTEEERLDFLTKTVLGEAVGDGPVGMMVVAQIIANRTLNARDFSSDPVAVAGQKYQFSANGPSAGGVAARYGKSTPEYQQAQSAVQAAIINRSLPDITGGSEYYHTIAMGWPSSWPSRIKQNGFVDIGGHRIYPNRPVTPGEIPANLVLAQNFGVGTMVDTRPPPTMPAVQSASMIAKRNAPAGGTTAAQAAAALGTGGAPAAGINIIDMTGNLSFNFGQMRSPDALVIHHTGGSGTNVPNVNGVIQTFEDRGLPAHFIIDRDGQIIRTLAENAQGRHTKPSERSDLDISNANSWGVEIIALNDKDVTPAQTAAALELTRYLGTTYGMPTDRVVGHGAINGHKQADEGSAVLRALRDSGSPVAAYAAVPVPAIRSSMLATLATVSEKLSPIRPAPLSTTLRLQREINRVAGQQANAPTTIRRNRMLAFGSTIDPFEIGRPANTNPVISGPERRATGTPNSTERTFAFDVLDASPDGDGVFRVSTALRTRPPAVATAPWGVRQTVAAQVAAAAADNGRGQLVMTGNPNIAGSVVDWLYPRVAEGEGEANQEGKGDRAPRRPGQTQIERGAAPRVTARPGQTQIERTTRPRPAPGQSTIERGTPRRPAPGQSQIERSEPRDPPIVVVSPTGQARVIQQSQIERPDVVTQSIRRANNASQPQLAATLATQIAARRTAQVAADVRTLRTANQNAAPAPAPAAPRRPNAVTPASTQVAADVRTMRTANQNAAPAVPGPNAPPKIQDRLPVTPPIVIVNRPPNPPRRLPPIAPPRSDPIGLMPDFRQLSELPSDPLRPVSPSPVSRDRAIAARNRVTPAARPAPPTADVIPIRPAAPVPADVETRTTARNRVTNNAPVPASAATRDIARSRPTTVAPTNGPTTRAVTTQRVTTVAPQPASVEDRVTARNAGAARTMTISRSGTQQTTRRPRPSSRPTPASQRPTPAGFVSTGNGQIVSQQTGGIYYERHLSPSGQSSGNGGGQAPTQVTIRSYNADTNRFESRTVTR